MTDESVLDGVRSVTLPDGVYRAAFFRFDADGKPQPELSLAESQSCAGQVLDAFSKMKR